jgi:hypothetical protein
MSAKPKRKRPYIPTGNPRGRPRKVRPIAAPGEPPQVAQQVAYRIKSAARAAEVSESYMKRKVAQGPPHGPRSYVKGRMRIILHTDLIEWLTLGT